LGLAQRLGNVSRQRRIAPREQPQLDLVFQRFTDGAHGRKALLGRLRQKPRHQRIQRRGTPLTALAQQRRLGRDVMLEHLPDGARLERQLPRHHLVENHPERILVDAKIDLVPKRHLRRQIRRRAHQRPRHRLRRDLLLGNLMDVFLRVALPHHRRFARRLGNAKVNDLNVVLLPILLEFSLPL
jgi:hypothetical protein